MLQDDSEHHAAKPIDYPTSDFRPMAESDIHRKEFMDILQTLQHQFRERQDVYVSGNLLLYYEEGKIRKRVAPDVFVVFGAEKKLRDYYLLWEEPHGPDVVIEITSLQTRREDLKKKWRIYRDILKVGEYFLFDPTAEYLEPRLQGYRLSNGEYQVIPAIEGSVRSQKLGFWLEAREMKLYFRDIDTGMLLPNFDPPYHQAERAADWVQLLAEKEKRLTDKTVQQDNMSIPEYERLQRERWRLQEMRANA